MDMVPRNELRTGDVGYIISGIKTSKEVKVGDTITPVSYTHLIMDVFSRRHLNWKKQFWEL